VIAGATINLAHALGLTTVAEAVGQVAAYVPGYHLAAETLVADGLVTVFVEVAGAGDYLPAYAGNLDIMTSAAIRVAERYAERFATT